KGTETDWPLLNAAAPADQSSAIAGVAEPRDALLAEHDAPERIAGGVAVLHHSLQKRADAPVHVLAAHGARDAARLLGERLERARPELCDSDGASPEQPAPQHGHVLARQERRLLFDLVEQSTRLLAYGVGPISGAEARCDDWTGAVGIPGAAENAQICRSFQRAFDTIWGRAEERDKAALSREIVERPRRRPLEAYPDGEPRELFNLLVARLIAEDIVRVQRRVASSSPAPELLPRVQPRRRSPPP